MQEARTTMGQVFVWFIGLVVGVPFVMFVGGSVAFDYIETHEWYESLGVFLAVALTIIAVAVIMLFSKATSRPTSYGTTRAPRRRVGGSSSDALRTQFSVIDHSTRRASVVTPTPDAPPRNKPTITPRRDIGDRKN